MYLDIRAGFTPRAQQVATATVDAGQAIVFATDTVYGIGASPTRIEAVNAVVATKGRTLASPPPVLLPEQFDLTAHWEQLPLVVKQLAERFWPGAMTLILPRPTHLPWQLGQLQTVAVRIPDHPHTASLLAAAGPLATSSANLHGEAPATTCEMAQAAFGQAVPLYLDSGSTPGPVASTILDVTGQFADPHAPVRILRQGALPATQIAQAIPEVKFAQAL